jgi:hypothetical protein
VQAQEELLAMAQIAVAPIGFSSLLSVFGARGSAGFSPRDLSGLAMALVSGAIPLVFSLPPFPVRHLGLSEDAVWTVSAATLSLVTFAALVVFVVVNRRLSRAGHAQRSPRANLVSQFLTGVVGTALALSACDVLLPREPGIYVLALITYLIFCLCSVVLVLVLVQRRLR